MRHVLRATPSNLSALEWRAAAQAIPEVKLPFELLKVVLGLVAGVLSGLIAPGTVRLSKCLMLAMSPPPPTRPHLSTGALPAAVMQLAVVLPVLGALFWVSHVIFMLSTCSDGKQHLDEDRESRCFSMFCWVPSEKIAVVR